MNSYNLVYCKNLCLFIFIGSLFGLIPAFILTDVFFNPSVEGFSLMVKNLDEVIELEIDRIVYDYDVSGMTEEKQIIDNLKKAQGEGEVLANNLMSFFLVYVFGAFCLVIIPIYIGVKISMRLSKKYYPLDIKEIKRRKQLE